MSEKQEGRELSGYAVMADGSKEQLVGVFKHSGKQIFMDTTQGVAVADLIGKDMEWCWAARVPNMSVAACHMLHKEGTKP